MARNGSRTTLVLVRFTTRFGMLTHPTVAWDREFRPRLTNLVLARLSFLHNLPKALNRSHLGGPVSVKLAASLVEAIIGAMYLDDKGHDEIRRVMRTLGILSPLSSPAQVQAQRASTQTELSNSTSGRKFEKSRAIRATRQGVIRQARTQHETPSSPAAIDSDAHIASIELVTSTQESHGTDIHDNAPYTPLGSGLDQLDSSTTSHEKQADTDTAEWSDELSDTPSEIVLFQPYPDMGSRARDKDLDR